MSIALASGAGTSVAADCDVRCIAYSVDAQRDASDFYLFDEATARSEAGNHRQREALAVAAGVVLPAQGFGRARSLLAAGARRVLLGEAALVDGSLIAALAREFGAQRVGVYVPARRLQVSWSFDAVSNADFKVLTPSVAAPAWEILRADGTRTGTQALWWIGEMLKAGAGEALLRVDIEDDADLNLCADCHERFGKQVWIGPLDSAEPALHDWARFGHARQLALPAALLAKVRQQDEAARVAGARAAQRAA